MEYVKLFIVLSWIFVISGVVQQIKAKNKVNSPNALGAWKAQTRATFYWSLAYLLLVISIIQLLSI